MSKQPISNRVSSPAGPLGEGGSALLMTMIITALVASLVAFTTMTSVNQTRAASNITNADENGDLANSIQMIYSTPQSCKVNLSPVGFGTTLSSLSSPLQGNSISLINPSVGAASGATLFGKDMRFSHELIVNMAFKAPVAVVGLVNVYLADLQIRTAPDKNSSVIQLTTTPFYFVTNASGVLQSCYATSYVPSTSGTVLTIEDSICKQLSGTAAGVVTNGLNTIYDPSQQNCVNVNRVAGQ